MLTERTCGIRSVTSLRPLGSTSRTIVVSATDVQDSVVTTRGPRAASALVRAEGPAANH